MKKYIGILSLVACTILVITTSSIGLSKKVHAQTPNPTLDSVIGSKDLESSDVVKQRKTKTPVPTAEETKEPGGDDFFQVTPTEESGQNNSDDEKVTIDDPLLNLELSSPLDPDPYEESVDVPEGTVDTAKHITETCPMAKGLAVKQSIAKFSWKTKLKKSPMKITFVPDNPGKRKFTIFMWEVAKERWWCLMNPFFQQPSLEYAHLDSGEYFIYLATPDSDGKPVTGKIVFTNLLSPSP